MEPYNKLWGNNHPFNGDDNTYSYVEDLPDDVIISLFQAGIPVSPEFPSPPHEEKPFTATLMKAPTPNIPHLLPSSLVSVEQYQSKETFLRILAERYRDFLKLRNIEESLDEITDQLRTIINPNRTLAQKIPLDWIEKALQRKQMGDVIYGCEKYSYYCPIEGNCPLPKTWIVKTRCWFMGIEGMPATRWKKIWKSHVEGYSNKLDNKLKALGLNRESATPGYRQYKQIEKLKEVFSPELAAVFLADVAGIDIQSRDLTLDIGGTHIIGIGEKYSNQLEIYQKWLEQCDLTEFSFSSHIYAEIDNLKNRDQFIFLDEAKMGIDQLLRSAIDHVNGELTSKIVFFNSIQEAVTYLYYQIEEYRISNEEKYHLEKDQVDEILKELLNGDLHLAYKLPIEPVWKWLIDRIEGQGFVLPMMEPLEEHFPHDFIYYLEQYLKGPEETRLFANYYPLLWTLDPLEFGGIPLFLTSWTVLKQEQREALEAFSKLTPEDQKKEILEFNPEEIQIMRDLLIHDPGGRISSKCHFKKFKNEKIRIKELFRNPDNFLKENGRVLPFRFDIDLVNIIAEWHRRKCLKEERPLLMNRLIQTAQEYFEEWVSKESDGFINELRKTKGRWFFSPKSLFREYYMVNSISMHLNSAMASEERKMPSIKPNEAKECIREALKIVLKRNRFLSKEESDSIKNKEQHLPGPGKNILNVFFNLKRWELRHHPFMEEDISSVPSFASQTAFLIEPSGNNILLEPVEVVISPTGRFEAMRQPLNLYDNAEALLKSALGSVPTLHEGTQGAGYVLSSDEWSQVLETANECIQKQKEEEKSIQERAWWIIPRHLGQDISMGSDKKNHRLTNASKGGQTFFGLRGVEITKHERKITTRKIIKGFKPTSTKSDAASLFDDDIGIHLLNRCAQSTLRFRRKGLEKNKEIPLKGSCWPTICIPDDLPPLRTTHSITPMNYQVDEVRRLQAIDRTARKVAESSEGVIPKVGRIVAFQMGLGKTLVAFHICTAPGKKSLIIAPKSTVPQTTARFTEWGARTSGCYKAKDLFTALKSLPFRKEGVIITTIDALKNSKNQKLVKDVSFDVIVVDEAQGYHAESSDSSHLLHKILDTHTEALPIMLTGTPYGNRLSDFGQLLSYVNYNYPKDLGSILQSIRNSAEQKLAALTKGTSTAANESVIDGILYGFFTQWALMSHLKSCMTLLEADDREVLKDLNEKGISVPPRPKIQNINVTLTEDQKMRIENLMPENWSRKTDTSSNSLHDVDLHTDVEIGGLFQVKGKVSRAMVHPDLTRFENSQKAIEHLESLNIDPEWVNRSEYLKALIGSEDFQSNVINGKEPAVIFVSDRASSIAIQKGIHALYGRPIDILDGRSGANARQKMIDNFGLWKNPVLIVGIKAGGAGLDLPQGRRAYLADAEYNPAHTEQAIFRILRLGSEGGRKVFRINCNTWIDRHVNQVKAIKRAEDRLMRDWLRSEIPVGDGSWKEKFRDYLKMLFVESRFSEEKQREAIDTLLRVFPGSLPEYLRKLEESNPIDSTWIATPSVEKKPRPKRHRSSEERAAPVVKVTKRPAKKPRQFKPGSVITTEKGVQVPEYQPIWITPDGKATNLIRIPLPRGTDKETAARLCRWMGDQKFARTTSQLHTKIIQGEKRKCGVTASSIFEGDLAPTVKGFFNAIEALTDKRSFEEFLGSTILKVMSAEKGTYIDKESVRGVRFNDRSPGRVYLVQHDVNGEIFYEALIDKIILDKNCKRKRD